MESGLSGSGKFVVVGFCQHDDELPRSIEGTELFYQLNDHERVQNNSAVHCYIKPCKKQLQNVCELRYRSVDYRSQHIIC